MNALLICPSIRPAVPYLADNEPLATVPVLGDSIVSHWVEHLAAQGARQVRIVASDRADRVRAEVGDGARWGLRIEVVSTGVEPSPEEAEERFRWAGEPDRQPFGGAILMSHLPGCPGLPLFESYAGWFEALLAWMPRALTPTRVRVREIRPGIWVGRRARVSPDAELIAPCWIGDQVTVQPGAVVGPGAIVEDRAVVEGEARVTRSWVGCDTLVGTMTLVADSLALGGTLINWRTDSSLRVPDPFLLCSLLGTPPAEPASRPARAPALTIAINPGSQPINRQVA